MSHRDGLTPVWEEFEFKQIYVNVYAVTRHWGGPEEGGWWWNYHNPIASFLILDPKTQDPYKVQEGFYRKYSILKEGNISSVLGGTDVAVYIEDHFAEPWPKERPYYE